MVKCARLSGGTLLSLIALCGGCDSSSNTGKTSTSTSVGTGTGSTSNLTLADLGGNYTLVDFTVVYDTGVVLTGQDVSASGTMTIDGAAATLTETVTGNGVTMSETGTDVAVVGNQLRLTDSARSCTYYLGFEFNNEVLTTHLKVGSFCGQYLAYSEDDVWKRTSRDTGGTGATALPMVLGNGKQPNPVQKGPAAGALGALIQP